MTRIDNQKNFELAKLRKFSELSFDIAKSIFIAGTVEFILSDWTYLIQKTIKFLAVTASSSFFGISGLKYLYKYYVRNNHERN